LGESFALGSRSGELVVFAAGLAWLGVGGVGGVLWARCGCVPLFAGLWVASPGSSAHLAFAGVAGSSSRGFAAAARPRLVLGRPMRVMIRA